MNEASDYIIKISALKNIGIDLLYKKISELFNLNQINLDNDVLITNIRQKDFINKAIENVKKAKETIDKNMTSDIVAIFIKDILEDLGSLKMIYKMKK